jgi:hypothetical protein
MGNILAILPIATLAAAAVGAGVTFWNAALALRAKERIRVRLKSRAPQLEALTDAVRRRELSPEEAQIRARLEIESAARTLSERDRELLEEGLNQPNEKAKGRYIKDLTSVS